MLAPMPMSFDQLCTEFCTMADMATPELRKTDDGILAFNVQWRAVDVDIFTLPAHDPGHGMLLFHLGSTESDDPQFSAILMSLLQANFVSMRPGQAVFSCHPQTCAAVLQMPFALAQTSGAELHRLVEEGVDLALQWRRSHFLQPSSPATGSDTPVMATFDC